MAMPECTAHTQLPPRGSLGSMKCTFHKNEFLAYLFCLLDAIEKAFLFSFLNE